MKIDVHCHIYPDRIASRAVAGTGEFYNMPLVYGGTFSDLLSLHEQNGIDRGLIFSVATTPHQGRRINRVIAESVAQSEGRLLGLGTVHPDSPTLKEDIEQIVSLGLLGVKLHPDIQQFKIDDYRCLKIYELCEGRLPILLHCGDSRDDFSNPNRLAPILSIFTELTVIGAHLGGWSVWDDAERSLAGFPNFYVDTSSSLYALSPARATEIIRHFGSERVLFGTDYPMWAADKELATLMSMNFTEEEFRKILWDNAYNLFVK